MTTSTHALCWIRRDLRLNDHTAMSQATHLFKQVSVVFVFDTTILSHLKDKDDRRITFIHESLQELDQALREHGSALVVAYGDPRIEIPKLAEKLNATAVFTNRDYEPAAKERDAEVSKKLAPKDISFYTFKDQVIFEGLEVKTGQGEPYRVFTPYKNSWLSLLQKEDYADHKVDHRRFTPIKQLKPVLSAWPIEKLGFTKSELWLRPGESQAKKKLKSFEKHMFEYDTLRDFPSATHGTSGMSVHLRFGTISIRSLVRMAKSLPSRGTHTWLSELIWRDFYQMILNQYPHVVKNAFKPQYDKIEWPGSHQHFEAWKAGQTGYPIVDAAMRHFAKTGWMHNRLRMIVASFLTKDLLVDWRKGESWFARKLLDFDLAANNGGWQWSASTGCDAQPYFRIFNPVSQSEKFDPEGQFIRWHVPELKDAPKNKIHWPHDETLFDTFRTNYAKPLVSHPVQRIKALKLFKRIGI